MPAWINKRIEFHKKSFRVLWVFVAIIWTIFSNAATVRDNFFSPVWQQRFATLNLLPKWRWYVWVIGVLVIVLIGVIEGSYRAAQSLIPNNKGRDQGMQAAAGPATTAEESEPTLLSLMDKGFPQLNKLWGKPVLNFEDGSTLQLTSALYFDLFTSGAKFLGFHVPRSPRALEAFSVIAARAIELGDALGNGGLKIISKAPGENPQTVSDLRYSGKVYLYHEDALTHKQMADVEEIFKSQQLIVVLRGPDFLTQAWLAWKQKSHGVQPQHVGVPVEVLHKIRPSLSGEILAVFWSKASGIRSSNFFVKLKLVNHEDIPCTIDRFWFTLTIGGYERRCLGYPSKVGRLQYRRPYDNAEVTTEVYPLTISYDTPLKLALPREGWIMFYVIECDMPNPAAPFWLMQNIKMAVVDSLGNEHTIGHSSVTVFPANIELSEAFSTTRPEIEGEIYRVVTGGKSKYAGEVRTFYKAITNDADFAIDVDILIEMYAVNTTKEKRFIRGFTFTVEVDGKVLPLIVQKDFYAYELDGVDYEYCLNLSSNKLDRSKLENLKPLYPSLPVELEAYKPLEGWVHFVVKGVDPEKLRDNRSYKLFMVDSLSNEHPIAKAVTEQREGTVTVRPIIRPLS